MADVLIAGGGIAGSALAIQLGRRGFLVRLYERKRFPKEKACGEGLMPAGVKVLERMGLAPEVGGARFLGVRYYFGSRMIEGAFPKCNGLSASGLGRRRRDLDWILFKTATATPGVRAEVGTRVEGPIIEKGHVTGLIVEGERYRAPLVVAADGVHSTIRRVLGFDMPASRHRVGFRAHFRLRDGREQPPWVEVFVCRGYELYVTPLPGREVLVAALAEADMVAGGVEQTYYRWCRNQPILASRLSGAEQITSICGASPLAGHARQGSAPGIVLLGDAAGFIDPITGGGMTQALMSAELLARHLPRPVDANQDWLHRFEYDRRKMLGDYRLLTGAMLCLARHPALARLVLSSLGATPRLFSHLIGVSAGVRSLFGRRAPQQLLPG